MEVIDLRGERPAAPGSRPTTAFVLGGGGNLGAIQVGMLSALLQEGILPDVLFGCSVGAINGAALAADATPAGIERLREMWCSLSSEVICPPGRLSGLLLLTRKYRALHSNGPLRQLLEAKLPYARLEDAAVRVEVVATSLRTGQERWFTRGPVVPAVLASAALPAVLPPVEIDGERFIDGAVVDNVPIARAVAAGATRIYVLHVGNFDRPRPEPRRPLEALLQSFSIARNYRFHADTRCPPPGVELVVLPSIDPGPVKPNDFGRSRLLIERAHEATVAYLRALQPAPTVAPPA